MDNPERDPGYRVEGTYYKLLNSKYYSDVLTQYLILDENTSSSSDSEIILEVMDIKETGSCNAETAVKQLVEDTMQNVFKKIFKKLSTVKLR